MNERGRGGAAATTPGGSGGSRGVGVRGAAHPADPTRHNRGGENEHLGVFQPRERRSAHAFY